MFLFRLDQTVDLFEIENLTTDRLTPKNLLDTKTAQNEISKEHQTIMSIEVKSEPISSDDEQSHGTVDEISTNYQRSNEAEAAALVEGTKNGRNIDRLSMDSYVSSECAPSTSNIPTTPHIDSAGVQGEIVLKEENIFCAKFIKLEQPETAPTSTENEMAVANAVRPPENEIPVTNYQQQKRTGAPDLTDSPSKKLKTLVETETIPGKMTRWNGELIRI